MLLTIIAAPVVGSLLLWGMSRVEDWMEIHR